MNPFYATREMVKLAGNIQGPGENARIDRLIAARTDSLKRLLGRYFYPTIETRLFDWPATNQTPYSLLLDADLIEVTTMTSNARPITDFFPYPANVGPPFSRIEINLGSGQTFQAGQTWQRMISVLGVWGYGRDLGDAGILAGDITNSDLSLDVADSSLVGVGDALKLDDEYVIASAKKLKDTSAALAGDIAGEESVRVVPVDDGSKINIGELITIDAERLYIEDVAGNNLVCRRAQDASLLAAHTNGTSVYAPRTLSVERSALGTVAAAHSHDLVIFRNVPPGLITELTVAEVLSAREQEIHGYGRADGQGDGAFELRGIGLADLRKRVIKAYTRGGGSRKTAI